MHDPDTLRGLDAFADRFAPVFARADQLRWFRLYLRGLLDGGERKNVEAIAARAGFDPAADTNPAQALQHFISHSPWDADKLLARSREMLPPAVRHRPAVWVVHDAVIPKKGRHSVGTQRQFARSLGRKLNCQLAVVVGLVGDHGYVPLAVRLYLPGYWLREHPVAVEKTVPEAFRTPRSRPDVAVGLIRDLLEEGWRPGRVVTDEGYTADEAFRDRLTADGFTPTPPAEAAPALIEARDGLDDIKSRLGLDHFEGRTWVGWHHHAAVALTAYNFGKFGRQD